MSQVTLVGSEDEFVRHSAGKTLAAVSEYLNLKHKVRYMSLLGTR